MKGEFLEGKDHHATNLFANMRQTQNFQPPPLNSLPHHPHHHNLHHFQLSQNPQTSEEEVSDTQQSPFTTAAAATHTTTTTNKEPPNSSDGATIEVVRRPRGRPPGSKNKPKPTVIITREPESAMRPYVLEIPAGTDLIEAVNSFCRKRNTGICILSASGAVANVTLRQPSNAPGGGATVTFHGRFDLLSLSASVFPSTASFMGPPSNEFSISLAGPQGQIVGGTAVGPLFTAGTMFVIAAAFNNPSFQRLPLEEDLRSSGSGGNEGQSSSPPVIHGGVDGGHPPATAAESCGMSFFSGGHLGSEAIWAPAVRPPPPPPY